MKRPTLLPEHQLETVVAALYAQADDAGDAGADDRRRRAGEQHVGGHHRQQQEGPLRDVDPHREQRCQHQ